MIVTTYPTWTHWRWCEKRKKLVKVKADMGLKEALEVSARMTASRKLKLASKQSK